MKRSLSALLLVCALSVPVLAGDIPIPPAPPPCQIDCPKSTTSTTTVTTPSPLRTFVIELLITLLRP